jgi:hypothetical protein
MPEVGAGELDEFIAPPAEHRLEHGSSIRMPRIPAALAIAAKFGLWRSIPAGRNPVVALL